MAISKRINRNKAFSLPSVNSQGCLAPTPLPKVDKKWQCQKDSQSRYKTFTPSLNKESKKNMESQGQTDSNCSAFQKKQKAKEQPNGKNYDSLVASVQADCPSPVKNISKGYLCFFPACK